MSCMHVDLLILHQTEETKKTRKRKKKKKAAEEGGKQIVGGNTPKSVNAYHRKQLVESFHTLRQRETTQSKNLTARRQRRRKRQTTPEDAHVPLGEPSICIVPAVDAEYWSTLDFEHLYDRDVVSFGSMDFMFKEFGR